MAGVVSLPRGAHADPEPVPQLEREAVPGLWLLKQSLALLRSPQAPVRRVAVWFTGGPPPLPAPVSSSPPPRPLWPGPGTHIWGREDCLLLPLLQEAPSSGRFEAARPAELPGLGCSVGSSEPDGSTGVLCSPRPPPRPALQRSRDIISMGGWRPCLVWGGRDRPGEGGRRGGGAPSRCSQAPPLPSGGALRCHVPHRPDHPEPQCG